MWSGHSINKPETNFAYSYRVPSPPRIIVPPSVPGQDTFRYSFPTLSKNDSHTNEPNHPRGTDSQAEADWTYEQRRNAQPIVPNLYLGPISVVRDESFLNKMSEEGYEAAASLVIGISPRGPFHQKVMTAITDRNKDIGIKTQTIEIANNQELIHAFPRIAHIITNHFQNQDRSGHRLGWVLVACESGNDRSAAAVAAYVMEAYAETDHIKAMQFIQTRRFCVNYDDDTKRLLQGYWDIISARRQVHAEHDASTHRSKPIMEASLPLVARHKRNLSDAETWSHASLDGSVQSRHMKHSPFRRTS